MKLFKWIGEWWTEKKRLRAALAAAGMEQQRQVRLVQAQLAESDAALKRMHSACLNAEGMVEYWKKQKRPHVVKVAERAMKEEDLQGELAVDDEDPMWRAVHQLLDREFAKQADTARTVAGTKRDEACGGMEALAELQATLLDYQKAGLKAEAKESEPEEAE